VYIYSMLALHFESIEEVRANYNDISPSLVHTSQKSVHLVIALVVLSKISFIIKICEKRY